MLYPKNPIEEIKNIYPLQAKRARSSSSEASIEQEHKKQKVFHPTFKRERESEGSGNLAPLKKYKSDELTY